MMLEDIDGILTLFLRIYSRIGVLLLILAVWMNWRLFTTEAVKIKNRKVIALFSILCVVGVILSIVDYFTTVYLFYVITAIFNSTTLYILAGYLGFKARKIKKLAQPGKLENAAQAFEDLLASMK